MKIGYVLCTPDRSQILSIKDGKIILLTIEKKEDLEKVFCIKDLTAIKTIYQKYREMNLVGNLDIVSIDKFYK